jgi:two-component system, OmpR family, sensor histidine kinase SenX3
LVVAALTRATVCHACAAGWTAKSRQTTWAPTEDEQSGNRAQLSRRGLDRTPAIPTIGSVRSNPAEPTPTSAAAAVLETVASTLETGVILLDDDDVLLANEAALSFRVVWDRELTSRVLSRLARQSRRDGVRITCDVDLPWGASSRAVHAVAAPVPGTAHVVLLLSDLQEARRLEAVRRDFIANVSHELKTPIGAMLLLAEALRGATDDPIAIKNFTDRLLHEAGRMSRLVQELLDLSRLQGGEPLPSLAAVRVSDIVADAADPLLIRADAGGIDLEIGVTDGLQVLGDRRQLVTAVTNLIENAIAYSARGAKVGVGARQQLEDGRQTVEITVSDEGVGIEKADQERVFERFYRVDTARSRATGGTGLGLAIVKHIMYNHGGRVSVWSRPGVGSTFTLHLPAAQPASASTPADEPAGDPPSEGTQP